MRKKKRFTFDYSFTKSEFNTTELPIFYNEMEETLISEHPKMKLADLVSTIEGLLPLLAF